MEGEIDIPVGVARGSKILNSSLMAFFAFRVEWSLSKKFGNLDRKVAMISLAFLLSIKFIISSAVIKKMLCTMFSYYIVVKTAFTVHIVHHL